MVRIALFVIAVLSAYLLGFTTGLCWTRSEQHVETPVAVQVEEPAEEPSDEERRVAEALSDPEFKKIHDHLMRENPIQMTLPTRPEEDKAPVPMSERAPVRFELP